MRKPKALFISPLSNGIENPSGMDVYPPKGLLIIASIFKDNGYDVDVIIMNADNVGYLELEDKLRTLKPDLIGISLTTLLVRSAKNICYLTKKLNPKTKIVVGGIHVTSVKEAIFEELKEVDIAIIGEGERPAESIAQRKPLNEINGIYYRDKKGNIIKNPPASTISDLDLLPEIDYGLINIKRYCGPDYTLRYPVINLMFARGCPFQCTFCNKALFENHKVRTKSVSAAIKEIENTVEKLYVKEIHFSDDTFNLNRKWLDNLLDEIIKSKINKKVAFAASFRVNRRLIDARLLKKCKEAGFHSIFFGVESGSDELLKSMKKGITVAEVKRAFGLAKEAGIRTIASFIVGLPGETTQTIDDSVKLMYEIKPYIVGVGAAIPFPGTELERVVKDNNRLRDIEYTKWSTFNVLFRTEELDYGDIEKRLKQFYHLSVKLSIRNILFDYRYLLSRIHYLILNPVSLKNIVRRISLIVEFKKKVLG